MRLRFADFSRRPRFPQTNEGGDCVRRSWEIVRNLPTFSMLKDRARSPGRDGVQPESILCEWPRSLPSRPQSSFRNGRSSTTPPTVKWMPPAVQRASSRPAWGKCGHPNRPFRSSRRSDRWRRVESPWRDHKFTPSAYRAMCLAPRSSSECQTKNLTIRHDAGSSARPYVDGALLVNWRC